LKGWLSATRPSLHRALPAIEVLYAAWERTSTKEQYTPLLPTLEAEIEKLNGYYQKTAESDAHIIAMGMPLHFL